MNRTIRDQSLITSDPKHGSMTEIRLLGLPSRRVFVRMPGVKVCIKMKDCNWGAIYGIERSESGKTNELAVKLAYALNLVGGNLVGLHDRPPAL